MTLDAVEKEFIKKLPPKRLVMCPNLQKAKDKKLSAALTVALGSTALADVAMRVVRECRG